MTHAMCAVETTRRVSIAKVCPTEHRCTTHAMCAAATTAVVIQIDAVLASRQTHATFAMVTDRVAWIVWAFRAVPPSTTLVTFVAETIRRVSTATAIPTVLSTMTFVMFVLEMEQVVLIVEA